MDSVVTRQARNGYRLLLLARVVGFLVPIPAWLMAVEIGWWWPWVLASSVFTVFAWWAMLLDRPARYIGRSEADGCIELDAPFRATPTRIALSDVERLFIHPRATDGVTWVNLVLKDRSAWMRGFAVYIPDAVVADLASVLLTVAPLRKWRDMPGQWPFRRR